MKKFYDSDYGRYYTIDELKTQFEELKSTAETDAETFEEYLDNCMYYNDGTLEEVKEMKTTKDEITAELENIINDVFYKFQEIESIKSGDIDPLDAYELDDITEKLADLIFRVLSYEK